MLRPLQDRVVVRRLEPAGKTASGLYLPDTAKEKPTLAAVVAVGPDAHGLQVGDQVLFNKYSGSEVSHGGEDLVILRADDVQAVVEP